MVERGAKIGFTASVVNFHNTPGGSRSCRTAARSRASGHSAQCCGSAGSGGLSGSGVARANAKYKTFLYFDNIILSKLLLLHYILY